jgi:hypothetical protein
MQCPSGGMLPRPNSHVSYRCTLERGHSGSHTNGQFHWLDGHVEAGAVTVTCPWWKRWWHRRLRKIDRRALFPAILERAEWAATDSYRRFSNEWRVERDFNYFAMLDKHANGLGQNHWRCACAEPYKSEGNRPP